MPNFKGGKKFKRQKKDNDPVKRNVRFKSKLEDCEVYGRVIKALGSCRFSINCCDGKTRLGQLRAGMKKSIRIFKDDWILVGLRSFETSDVKCDILYKYFPDEVLILKKHGELTILSLDEDDDADDDEKQDENMAFDFEDI